MSLYRVAMSAVDGERLIERCKQHVLATMRALPECAPDCPGLRSKELERQAGLALGLPEQDGWFTWSILMALVAEGSVQVLRTGKRGVRHFRLASPTQASKAG
jgi:hypothetical protein